MAEGMNRAMLLGNLGADPELRVTQGGQSLLKLRLATSENYLDKKKVRQERTDWHQVLIWGRRAEGLAKVLSKGSRIFIEGRIQTSSYEDKEGNKRYKTEIVASHVILCGGAAMQQAKERREEPDEYGDSYDPSAFLGDDDIPF